MRGLNNGGISFGIATALAASALLVLGGRLAIILSSPVAQAMPIVSKEGLAESLRAAPEIHQDSTPSPAAERKLKDLRPMAGLSRVEGRRSDSVQRSPWAEPMVKVQMPAAACAMERKADRRKSPGGFRVAVGRIATKIFSVGRKKKVDIALRKPAEENELYTIIS